MREMQLSNVIFQVQEVTWTHAPLRLQMFLPLWVTHLMR